MRSRYSNQLTLLARNRTLLRRLVGAVRVTRVLAVCYEHKQT